MNGSNLTLVSSTPSGSVWSRPDGTLLACRDGRWSVLASLWSALDLVPLFTVDEALEEQPVWEGGAL